MKKGIALVSAIFLILVVLLVGFGSYTTYIYYTDETFDFFGLLPNLKIEVRAEVKQVPGLRDELQKYAVGANAELFIIGKMDDLPDTSNQKQYDLIKDLDSVIILGKNCPECSFDSAMSIAALFKSEESANNFKNSIENDKVMGAALVNYKAIVEGKVVTISNTEDRFNAFSGSLMDNPNFNNFTTENFNSNLIFFADNTKVPEFSYAIFALTNSFLSSVSFTNNPDAFIPTAHAQGSGLIRTTDQPARIAGAIGGTGSLRQSILSSVNFFLGLSKTNYGFIDYKNGEIEISMNSTLPTKEEFPLLPAAKMNLSTVTEEEFDTYYAQAISSAEAKVQTLKTDIENMKKEYPELQMNVTLDQLSIEISAIFREESFAPNATNPGDAPSRARDAARKANLNNIIVAIETYNSDYGSYPQISACVANIPELQAYFIKGNSPTDFNGSRIFETADGSLKIICPDGYLYQYFDEDEYILWSQLENSSGGKLDYLITNRADYKEQTSGRYFTYGNINNKVPGEMTPYKQNEPPTNTDGSSKVKRSVTN